MGNDGNIVLSTLSTSWNRDDNKRAFACGHFTMIQLTSQRSCIGNANLMFLKVLPSSDPPPPTFVCKHESMLHGNIQVKNGEFPIESKRNTECNVSDNARGESKTTKEYNLFICSLRFRSKVEIFWRPICFGDDRSIFVFRIKL